MNNSHPHSRMGRPCVGPYIVDDPHSHSRMGRPCVGPYISDNSHLLAMGPYGIIRKKTCRYPQHHNTISTTYFITICTKHYQNIFGNCIIHKNHIELSHLGKIIDMQWRKIEHDYKYVELDNYIIMPNHFHAILTIQPSINQISDIICSFKSKTTVEYLQYIKENQLDISCKIWKRSFHDRIIRNNSSLYTTRTYITNNPKQWNHDKYNILSTEENHE